MTEQQQLTPKNQRWVAWVSVSAVLISAMYFYDKRNPVQPVTPTTPVVQSWSELVPESKDRLQLAAYLDAWVLMLPQVRDLAHYSRARKVGDPALQEVGQLTGSLAAFDKQLASRLEKAVGGTLDPGRTDLDPIANEMALIAQELRT